MAQFNPKEIIFGGDKEQYYYYDGELYTRTFPIEWAKNHLPDTGPKECGNCALLGCWNGVFIGYCLNCSFYEYNGERGRGFIEGKEYDGKVFDDEELIKSYASAFDTYLKDINLDDIGDKDFMDSALMCSQNKDINPKYDYAEDISEAGAEDGADSDEVFSWCIDRVGDNKN